MTLKEIYRIALARGLTAKQAGAEFGVKFESISKMKGRLNLPSLITEYEYSDRQAIKNMSNSDLEKYFNVLSIKNGYNLTCKEMQYAYEELIARGLKKDARF